MRARAFSGLSKMALVVAVSGLGAACSADVTRFDENPFHSRQVASAPQNEVVAAAPTTRVEQAPLTPANDFVVAQPPGRPAPVDSSPFGAGNADPGLTTGSVRPRQTFGSSAPQTPGVRQMAMSRTVGDQPVAAGRGGWSAAGGTSIRVNQGDTAESLSRRYGVPSAAIAQANNLSPGQALGAGQTVIIPTYSMASAPTAPNVPSAPAAGMTRAEAPAAAPRPAAPQHVAAAQPRNDTATAPVPAARMNWQAGQTPANQAPAAQAQHAQPQHQGARPSSHTVAMGESLTTIAAKYGMTRAQLASANGLTAERPVRIGQTLKLPGAAPTAQAQREQAQRSVALARNTPAGQRADTQATGSIAPNTATAREAPAETQSAAAPAAAPAAAAGGRTEQAAAPAAAAHSSDPQFRWPVRGRVISSFRPGSSDGIKLSVPEGTPIKAAEDGVVAYAGSELRGYGNLILVRHSNGFVTAYAHNSEIKVRRGEQVRRGQTIASAGQTGNVNSPQLHFEIRRGATPVDPMTYLGSN
jgi:murein DD-endopeptidase MepM/ murein hydrolase activator NlpD